MKYLFYISILAVFMAGCKSPETEPPAEPEFIRAVDFSFLPEIEQEPAIYYDALGNARDALKILQDSGCNMVRIRIWHTPQSGHSNLQEVDELAARIHSMGMKVWLCVHYSDSWADPGKQATPAAWEGLDLETLKDSVYNYTRLITQQIEPDLIQVGNEINAGFMWETGRITSGDNFYQLLNEGIRAVRDVSDCRIIVHYAGIYGSEDFFQQLKIRNVSYDYIGLSYYPIWHGKDIGALVLAISNLGLSNGKKVIIAETAYPFSLGYNDWTTNIIGSNDQILPQYPATPQGQKNFVKKIKSILKNDQNGLGFCYWGGEWVAFRGPEALNGSSWENQALFDFQNKALPVIGSFSE